MWYALWQALSTLSVLSPLILMAPLQAGAMVCSATCQLRGPEAHAFTSLCLGFFIVSICLMEIQF